jgi:hypothetical protein
MAGTDSGVGMDQQEPNSVVDDEQRFNQWLAINEVKNKT